MVVSRLYKRDRRIDVGASSCQVLVDREDAAVALSRGVLLLPLLLAVVGQSIPVHIPTWLS